MKIRDLRLAWRWLFNVECMEPYCRQRRICWRWHVDVLSCPTCRRDATEFEDAYGRIAESHFAASPGHGYWRCDHMTITSSAVTSPPTTTCCGAMRPAQRTP